MQEGTHTSFPANLLISYEEKEVDEERLAYTSEHAARFTTHKTYIHTTRTTYTQTDHPYVPPNRHAYTAPSEAWAMAIPPCRALGRVRRSICQAIVPGDT